MSSSSGVVQAAVPFCNGNNFEDWKVKMKVFLEYQEVFDVVEIRIPTTESDIQNQEAKKKDRKALYFIQASIHEKVFKSIADAETANQAWNILEMAYKPREVRVPIPHALLPSEHSDPTINGETRDKYLKECVAMYDAAMRGDWKAAEGVLNQSPGIARAKITQESETPLHIAVAAGQKFFAKKLVEKMEPEDLEIQEFQGFTAFDFAVASGMKGIAEMIAEKNPTIRLTGYSLLPAIFFEGREMVWYLFNKIDLEQMSPAQLSLPFLSLITCGMYDVALEMFRRHNSLAFHNLALTGAPKFTALDSLAKTPSAFASKNQLGVFKRCINLCCNIPFHSDLMRTYAYQLVDEMWKEIIGSPQKISDFMSMSPELVHIAAASGNIEFLKILLRSYPLLIEQRDCSDLSLFHVAAINRQERVFNILYELGSAQRGDIVLYREKGTRNRMSHLVATLPPPERLHVVSGAALQMQRELMWFEAVKNVLPKTTARNPNAYYESAEDLFSRHHKDLQKEGEEWMKSTAQSCMIVATLVATVVFAAAFTVPGGNDQSSGIPILKGQKWFNIFTMSNAIALSTSSLAIVFFLSILTSRYAESDFRRSLPFKLVCGLLTLTVSISAMLVAFTASFFLIYNQNASWFPILFISVAILPITLFVLLHRNLLFDTMRSIIQTNSLFRPSGELFPRKRPSLLSWILPFQFRSIWPRRKTNLS